MDSSTRTTPRPVRPVDGTARRLLPLVDGEQLAREEFHRRYEAMPESFRAELIEGVVHVTSPVRIRHSGPHAQVVGLLFNYACRTRGVEVLDNATDYLDDVNEFQPDAILYIESEAGGQTRTSEDDYLEGPPELVVEVAASTVRIDTKVKREVYQRLGVREYIVWRVPDQAIDWWELREEAYVLLTADEAGVVCSRVFPGLCLDVPAILSGDSARALATLEAHLAKHADAHADFVGRNAKALGDETVH